MPEQPETNLPTHLYVTEASESRRRAEAEAEVEEDPENAEEVIAKNVKSNKENKQEPGD